MENFKIPKKDTRPDVPVNVDLASREGQELLRNVTTSYLYPKSKSQWQVTHIATVHQRERDRLYAEKKAELRLVRRNMCEIFCFVPLKESCEDFLDAVSMGNCDFKCLGESELGVYASRHADLCFQKLHNLGKTAPIVMMIKTIITRCKLMPLLKDQKGMGLEPTPNFDCHLSSESACPIDGLGEAFPKSLVYLYEYDDDMLPMRRPRHCLPVAMLSFANSTAVVPDLMAMPALRPYSWKENVITPLLDFNRSQSPRAFGTPLIKQIPDLSSSTLPSSLTVNAQEVDPSLSKHTEDIRSIDPLCTQPAKTQPAPRVSRITFHQKSKAGTTSETSPIRKTLLFGLEKRSCMTGKKAESPVCTVDKKCSPDSVEELKSAGVHTDLSTASPCRDVPDTSSSSPDKASKSYSDVEPILNRLQLQSAGIEPGITNSSDSQTSKAPDQVLSEESKRTRDNLFSSLLAPQSAPVPVTGSDSASKSEDVATVELLRTDAPDESNVAGENGDSTEVGAAESRNTDDTENISTDSQSTPTTVSTTDLGSDRSTGHGEGENTAPEAAAQNMNDGSNSMPVGECKDDNAGVGGKPLDDSDVSAPGNNTSGADNTVCDKDGSSVSAPAVTKSLRNQSKMPSESFGMSLRKRTPSRPPVDKRASESAKKRRQKPVEPASCSIPEMEEVTSFAFIQTMSISAEEYEQMNLVSEDSSDCLITSTSTMMLDANAPIKEEMYDPFYPTDEVLNPSELNSQSCVIVISPENTDAPFCTDIPIKQEKDDSMSVDDGSMGVSCLESSTILTSSPVSLSSSASVDPTCSAAEQGALTPCVYNDIALDLFGVFSSPLVSLSHSANDASGSMATGEFEPYEPLASGQNAKSPRGRGRKKKSEVHNIAKYDLEFKSGVLKKMSGSVAHGCRGTSRGRVRVSRGAGGSVHGVNGRGQSRGRGRGASGAGRGNNGPGGVGARGRGRGRYSRGRGKNHLSQLTVYNGIQLIPCEVKLVDYRKIPAPKRGATKLIHSRDVSPAKRIKQEPVVNPWPMEEIMSSINTSTEFTKKRKTDVLVDYDSDGSNDSDGSVESNGEERASCRKVRRISLCLSSKEVSKSDAESKPEIELSTGDVLDVNKPAEASQFEDHKAGENKLEVKASFAVEEEGTSLSSIGGAKVPSSQAQKQGTCLSTSGEKNPPSVKTEREDKCFVITAEAKSSSLLSEVKDSKFSPPSSSEVSQSEAVESVTSLSPVKGGLSLTPSTEEKTCLSHEHDETHTPAVGKNIKTASEKNTDNKEQKQASSSESSEALLSSANSSQSGASPSKMEDDVSSLVVGLCKHMNKIKDKAKRGIIMAAIRVLLNEEEDSSQTGGKDSAAGDAHARNLNLSEHQLKPEASRLANNISDCQVSSTEDSVDAWRVSRSRRHGSNRDPRLSRLTSCSTRDPRLSKHIHHHSKLNSQDMADVKSDVAVSKPGSDQSSSSEKQGSLTTLTTDKINDSESTACQPVSLSTSTTPVTHVTCAATVTLPVVTHVTSCSTVTAPAVKSVNPVSSPSQVTSSKDVVSASVPTVTCSSTLAAQSLTQVTFSSKATVPSVTQVTSSTTSATVSSPAHVPSNVISKLLIKDIAAMQKNTAAKKRESAHVSKEPLPAVSAGSSHALPNVDGQSAKHPACVLSSMASSKFTSEQSQNVPTKTGSPCVKQTLMVTAQPGVTKTGPESMAKLPSSESMALRVDKKCEGTPNEELWADVNQTHQRDGQHLNITSSSISPQKPEVTHEILSALKARIHVLRHDVEDNHSDLHKETVTSMPNNSRNCDFNENCIVPVKRIEDSSLVGSINDKQSARVDPTEQTESKIFRNPSPPRACSPKVDSSNSGLDNDCFPIPLDDVFKSSGVSEAGSETSALSQQSKVGENNPDKKDVNTKCSDAQPVPTGSHLSSADVTLPLFPTTSVPSLTKLLSGKTSTPPPVHHITPCTKNTVVSPDRPLSNRIGKEDSTDIPLFPKTTTTTSLTHLLTAKMSSSPLKQMELVPKEPKKESDKSDNSNRQILAGCATSPTFRWQHLVSANAKDSSDEVLVGVKMNDTVPDEDEWLYGEAKTPKPVHPVQVEDADLSALTNLGEAGDQRCEEELDEWIYGDEASVPDAPVTATGKPSVSCPFQQASKAHTSSALFQDSGRTVTHGNTKLERNIDPGFQNMRAIRRMYDDKHLQNIRSHVTSPPIHSAKTIIPGLMTDMELLSSSSHSTEAVIPGLNTETRIASKTASDIDSERVNSSMLSNKGMIGPITSCQSPVHPTTKAPIPATPPQQGIFVTGKMKSVTLCDAKMSVAVADKHESQQPQFSGTTRKSDASAVSSTILGRTLQGGHREEVKSPPCTDTTRIVKPPDLCSGMGGASGLVFNSVPASASLPVSTAVSSASITLPRPNRKPLPYYSTPPGSGKTLHQLFSNTMKTPGQTQVPDNAALFQKKSSSIKGTSNIKSPDIRSSVSPDQYFPSVDSGSHRTVHRTMSSPGPDPVTSPACRERSKPHVFLHSPASPTDAVGESLRSPMYSALATPRDPFQSPSYAVSPADAIKSPDFNALKSPMSPTSPDHSKARRYTSSQFTRPAITIKLSNTAITEGEFRSIDREVCDNYKKFVLAYSVWKNLDAHEREDGVRHARLMKLDTQEAQLTWALANHQVRIECRITYIESHKFVNSLLKFPDELRLDPSTPLPARTFPLSTHQKQQLQDVKDAVIKLRADNGSTPADKRRLVKVIVEKLKEWKEILSRVMLPQLPEDAPGNDLDLISAIYKKSYSSASPGKRMFLNDKLKALKCQARYGSKT